MLKKIVSGGQTGVDRGALDAALAREFPCGGWCPKGRKAEDGPIPDRYPLTEMNSASYLHRTRQNVSDSDGTLILSATPLLTGTRATAEYADSVKKPLLVIEPANAEQSETLTRIMEWLEANRIETLNVAGPRGSADPAYAGSAERLLGEILDRVTAL